MSASTADPRRTLLDAFQAALVACRGGPLVEKALHRRPPARPLALLACGKAAEAMADGAGRVLGTSVARALIISPGAAANPAFPARCLVAEHPVPGSGSLAAGRMLLEFLDHGENGETLLVLLSGGASSLAEVLPEGMSLEALRRAWEWLLASGLDIRAVNAVRQRLSRIKGGGLAARLGGRRALLLALSDVPGDDPAVFGSGWFAPPLPAPEPGSLPGWITAMLTPPAAPAPGDPAWRDIETRIIGNNAMAVSAAVANLRGKGLDVHRHDGWLSGSAEAAAADISRVLETGPPGVHVWGGECTVRLCASPGRGGRCQHLALAVASRLAGRGDWWLLAAGTDGRDGNADAAGALVDGGTLERGGDADLDAGRALAGYDSGTFLEAAGDLVDTGPTGTNVNDLVIAAKAQA